MPDVPQAPGPDRVPVSVVVCTRERPVLLERCLTGLLGGDVLPQEVLVLDQSRDDLTRALVARLRAVPGGDVLRHVPHAGVGMAASQNAGFRAASTGVVLVTDDDAVPAADWVRTGHALFDADPGLSLVAGRVLALGEDAPDLFPVSTRTSTVPLALDARTPPWDVGSGNCFGLRRDAAVRTGNDERLGPGAPLLGGADMDLFRRVLREGRGQYAPELVVLHERADRQGRLGRRVPYGYGLGAAVVLWWRQGDRQALRLLLLWLGMRLRRLAGGVKRRDRLRVHEELLVLRGTAQGIARAARLADAAPLRSDGP